MKNWRAANTLKLRRTPPVVWRVRKRLPNAPRVWTQTACVKLHAAMVAFLGVLYLVASPWSVLIAGGTAVSGTYLFLAYTEAKRERLLLNPMTYLYGYFAASYGMAGVFVGTQLNETGLNLGFINMTPADIAEAFLLCVCGMLMLDCGLRLVRPNPSAAIVRAVTPLVPNRVSLAKLLCIGVVGSAIIHYPTGFRSLGAMLGILHTSALVPAFVAFLAPEEALAINKRQRLLFGLLMTAITLAASFAQLSKSATLMTILPFGAYLWQDRSRRRLFGVFAVVIIIGYLGFLAPTVESSRKLQGDWYSRAQQSSRQAPLSTGEFFGQDYVEQARKLGWRLFEVPAVGAIIAETQYEGFLAGESLRVLGYSFVPRILWPDKPNVSRGAWFSAKLGFARTEEDATTSTGMLAVGELYWDFGLPAVILGMFGIGCLFGLLWRLVGPDPFSNLLHTCLYLFITVTIIAQAEATSMVVSSIYYLLLFGVVHALGSLGRGRRTARMLRQTTLRPVGPPAEFSS